MLKGAYYNFGGLNNKLKGAYYNFRGLNNKLKGAYYKRVRVGG
jgi:hypothetical protein